MLSAQLKLIMIGLFCALRSGEKRSIVGLCEHLRRKQGAKKRRVLSCFCDYVTNFNPDVGLVSRWQYAFVVENGVLKSYATSSGRRYAVTKKRDAQGKGFYFP